MTDIVNDPHPFEEDPEECMGEITPDPWDDPAQTDWVKVEPEKEKSE